MYSRADLFSTYCISDSGGLPTPSLDLSLFKSLASVCVHCLEGFSTTITTKLFIVSFIIFKKKPLLCCCNMASVSVCACESV